MKGKSTLQKYFIQNGGHLVHLIAYNPVVTIAVLICGKLMSYVGTFVDLLIMVLSYALTIRLKGTTFRLQNHLLVQTICVTKSGNKALQHSGSSSNLFNYSKCHTYL